MTECFKVPFSIGKYCDVVDMDICNLLFGRPWWYHVKMQHSGRSNMYGLEKDSVKYTLLSLKG